MYGAQWRGSSTGLGGCGMAVKIEVRNFNTECGIKILRRERFAPFDRWDAE